MRENFAGKARAEADPEDGVEADRRPWTDTLHVLFQKLFCSSFSRYNITINVTYFFL